MKKFLALVMLASMSVANATEINVKEVSADFLNGAQVDAKIVVARGEPAVKITTVLKKKEVGPRNSTIITKRVEIVKVEELEMVGNKIILEDTVCGKVVSRKMGPRSRGMKKMVKLTGACKMVYDADPGSVLIKIVTK